MNFCRPAVASVLPSPCCSTLVVVGYHDVSPVATSSHNFCRNNLLHSSSPKSCHRLCEAPSFFRSFSTLLYVTIFGLFHSHSRSLKQRFLCQPRKLWHPRPVPCCRSYVETLHPYTSATETTIPAWTFRLIFGAISTLARSLFIPCAERRWQFGTRFHW